MAPGAVPGDLVHLDPHAVIRTVRELHAGFLPVETVDKLGRHPVSRLWQVVVRCGGCRFVCALQDVEHLVGIITREGSDYVRDVGLVAGGEYR